MRVTGPAAQFGRGVMQDVSAKLMKRFADCLAEQMQQRRRDEAAAEEPAEATPREAAVEDDDRTGSRSPRAAPSASSGISTAEPSPRRPSASSGDVELPRRRALRRRRRPRPTDDVLDLGEASRRRGAQARAPARSARRSRCSILIRIIRRDLNPETPGDLLDAFPDDGPPRARGPDRAGARGAHRRDEGASRARACRSTRVEDTEIAGVPVRVYEPEGARGTVAYLHGGGWVMGNLDSVDAVCRALANDAGARVVSIDYRLAPEHPFPAALDDALNVVRGARRAARRRRRLARAATSPRSSRAKVPSIKLQLLIYPVTDAGLNTPSYSEFDERLRPHRGRDAALLASSTWTAPTASHPDASPLRARPDGVAARVRRSPPATTSCATRARPTRPRSSAPAAGSCTASRAAIHGFWRWQTTEIARATVRDAARGGPRQR